eukprot:338332_1
MSELDSAILRHQFDSDEMCITCPMSAHAYNSIHPWKVFWIVWIVGMIIIIIDVIKILRDCIVTFYITHYEDMDAQMHYWPYLEYNAYRLQQEYKQIKCAICCELFNKTLPQSLLLCGDRFCQKCINSHEHQRWIGFEDRLLTYEWSECPICDIPYHIIGMKYTYSREKYLGFWSFYSITLKQSLMKRTLMFMLSLVMHQFLFCHCCY